MQRLLIVVVLFGSLMVAAEAHAAAPFVDVPVGHLFETEIDWMADEAITQGCNPPANDHYCPDDAVTRGQMAAFLVRALGLTDNGGGDLFDDDDSSIFAGDIDRLGTAGITQGCNPPANDHYCPDDVVTRGQMAAFLVRALGLTDNGGGDLFDDDDSSIFAGDIDRLGTAGITQGCNPPANDLFCPDDVVTRGQMAAFLNRALADDAPVEDPTITTTTLPDTIVGASYAATLAASGGVAPYTWSLDSGSLPTGIDLSATGELTGNTSTSGVYPFTVSVADDAGGSDTANLSIAVVDAELEITTTLLPVGVDGEAYDYQMEASGGAPPYEWEVVGALTLPPDLTISSDGLISGTPRVGAGSGGIEFQVTDTDATVVAKTLTMTMTVVPVQIDTTDLPDGTTGEEYQAELTLSGGVRPTVLTVLTGDLPMGIEMDSSGDFTGVPAVPGVYDFTVEAVDGAATSDTADLSITVLPGPMTVNALVRASVATDGSQTDMASTAPAIAEGGRYVVFETVAALVAGDTNGVGDIYRHDLQTGATVRVSVDLLGGDANQLSYDASVSSTGRYVAFSSSATDLVTGDGNLANDIFVRDMQAGATIRVSVDSAGAEANGHSYFPSISADGQMVTFTGYGDNMVATDTNLNSDVFVHHIPSAVTRLVSVDTAGAQLAGGSTVPVISGDGSTVIFTTGVAVVPEDTNGTLDLYAVDLATMDVELVSADDLGKGGNDSSFLPSVSANGKTVAFTSHSDDLVTGDTNGQVDVFVRLRDRGETVRVSEHGGVQSALHSINAAMAPGGRFVAFLMAGDELDPLDDNGDEDVYMFDIAGGTLRRVSVRPDGIEGNGGAGQLAVSSDGSRVVFEANAENLVDDDTNSERDIFAVRLIVPPTE